MHLYSLLSEINHSNFPPEIVGVLSLLGERKGVSSELPEGVSEQDRIIRENLTEKTTEKNNHRLFLLPYRHPHFLVGQSIIALLL
jgi:hypothetical protein